MYKVPLHLWKREEADLELLRRKRKRESETKKERFEEGERGIQKKKRAKRPRKASESANVGAFKNMTVVILQNLPMDFRSWAFGLH